MTRDKAKEALEELEGLARIARFGVPFWTEGIGDKYQYDEIDNSEKVIRDALNTTTE